MNYNEVWKDIEGYEKLYQISNYGRVKSLERKVYSNSKFIYTQKEKILIQKTDKLGYKKISLCKNGKNKTFFVHRLVAITFLDNPNNYSCVNHKDENPSNNYLENLEFCSHKYNMNYGTRNERISKRMTKKCNILQIDKEGNIINKWDNIKQIKNELGIQHIYECINGKRKTAGGYIWKSEKEVVSNDL